jgi:hypothetical protein
VILLPMMNIAELTPQQLRKAAKIKETIAQLQAELIRLLGTNTKPGAVAKKGARKKMSAAARAKISVAAKARWAKWKARKK